MGLNGHWIGGFFKGGIKPLGKQKGMDFVVEGARSKSEVGWALGWGFNT